MEEAGGIEAAAAAVWLLARAAALSFVCVDTLILLHVTAFFVTLLGVVYFHFLDGFIFIYVG